jgi:GntR family transcriptional regulator / MocR family aminotransferase
VSDSWATSSVDLHLDRTGSRVRVGLEVALRDAVRTHRLTPGVRLPSSRALAVDLGIARNTVAEAYGQLVAEGWLVAQRGSGTRVAARPPVAEAAPPPPPPVKPPRYDLRAGSPDSSSFPRAAWLSAARRALSAAPPEALGYSDPRGRPELRQALADYLARARGVYTSPDQIVICAGFTQGLVLICRALRDRGARTLAMEAYGVQGHRGIVADSGLRIQSLPVDEDGADVGQLQDANAVLLTAAHQFPLGGALAPDRRSLAVRWASENSGLVIEDDYDGEFRYDRDPVGAMQALAPDHVIYAGTASKSLAPGLRLGWLALPTSFVQPVVDVQALTMRNVSSIDQLTLAELITSGAYDRHVRRARLIYRRRRDQLVTALRRDAPRSQVTGIAAGLHVMLRLESGFDEDELIADAADRGLALEGLGEYSPTNDPRPAALVIGYGGPPAHAYTAAVARLTAVLSEAERRATARSASTPWLSR